MVQQKECKYSRGAPFDLTRLAGVFQPGGREKAQVPVYDAFISYSHAKDKPIAASLQSVVQTLGKPWYRRRALRVFATTRAYRRPPISGHRSRRRLANPAI